MSHGAPFDRNITVDGLSRVEGEGSLSVQVRDGVVTNVALNIFEPPRYFEALLLGRRHSEAPDITARICGICPVAYQMSACAAIEDACGVQVSNSIRKLRRLLYCGEWIQSHALHIYLLHAPDFLGYADAVEMAEQHRSVVERGLRLKRVGNLIMQTIGGRAVHPVNVRVGGFYRCPDRPQIAGLIEPLQRALDDALETVQWVGSFDFPDFEADYDFVSLRSPGSYPIESGRVVSSNGLDVTPSQFAELVVEEHVSHSTALHARLEGKSIYLTGPLARYANNSIELPEVARAAARAAGLADVCRNPFRSIIVRSVELVFACAEALSLASEFVTFDPAWAEVLPRASLGTGATEAPRGLLFHSYAFDSEGIIQQARIVPPTSQNQLTIEDDLRRVTQQSLDVGDDELTKLCEQSVRNHDPCISCAAHFLEVTVDR